MLMANKLWREENISRNLRRRKARETMKNFIDFISCISLLLLVLSLPVSQSTRPIQTTNESTPVPTPWPEQFHALLSMSSSNGRLQITNLWYDWPKGLNVNIMQKELGKLLYDVEWNNGTSFYYTLGANGVCEVMNFEVGIPRPDFLDGATYLGIQEINSFKCNVWEKADFIWYYEDVVTKVPVGWDFYDGITTRVITYEVGAVLEVSQVQAPAYCFTQNQNEVLQGNELQISLQGMTSMPEFEARKVHLRTSSEGSTVFYTSL